jgi:hypothetical protein
MSAGSPGSRNFPADDLGSAAMARGLNACGMACDPGVHATAAVGLAGTGILFEAGAVEAGVAASLRMARLMATAESFGVRSIATPYGAAVQSSAAAALAARTQVQEGALLYRIGTTGKSQAAEAQFWSLEHPLSTGYASRYGIPAGNVSNANFIEAARLRTGAPFVTRAAPGIGKNVGGGIEVVVPSGGVQMQWFTGMP